ncbi:XRE family transcriptional regulator [Thiopseudomonas alkaliphila]|uniref:DNA/RNA nuclease SfsA n=1 Tax=Thiopseudomonas alkaliphila TaxID=1697053 RepID=UPI00069E4A3C|nr:DNA/RNA nuclease SfsA [Thiopseudomonas alkaliphila]AKX44690.1 XRE family transcriptional regulator [Thiopseudomonas alkaliphila]
MQFDPVLEEGRLIKRYKRFFADVECADGSTLTIHCPNTGSMKNCMQEGGKVWFSRTDDPKRKLKGTWELAQTPQGRIACINTGRANRLIEEALQAGIITELQGFDQLQREVRYGEENSRADFCLSFGQQAVFVEVKSVTLGFTDTPIAAFPDAVTARGAKHLRELKSLAEQGQRAVLIYCVNLTEITAVRVASEIDPAYATALQEAKQAGVEVLAYACDINTQSIKVTKAVQVLDEC